jgi:hypothetical protein
MKPCNVHVIFALAAPLALALFLGACTKPEASPSPSPSATEVTTFTITGTPPSAPARIPSASAPVPSASAPSPSRTSAVASTRAASASSSARPGAPLKPAATRITGNNFALDVASPGCRVDVPCVVTLHLSVLGAFHVNSQYPYKFVGNPAPGIAFLGHTEKNVFSRALGDLQEDGEKSATLTVRFTPSAAGEAPITGTYKMSICSAENCQIESPSVTLAVPVI